MVEVDPETGTLAIRRYVCVEDTGRMINPLIVEGQVQGAIAQGIGGALSEHLIYDAAGQLLTGTLMEYALPTAAAMPPLELDHVEEPADNLAGRARRRRGRHAGARGRARQRGGRCAGAARGSSRTTCR